LLVDDNSYNLFVLTEIIRALPGGDKYEIEEALSGEQALEKCSNQAQFNVVFMDLSMPGMDGYQCAKNMRELQGKA